MALKSESGCYFTHLQAAASFLESLAIEREADGSVGGATGGTAANSCHSPCDDSAAAGTAAEGEACDACVSSPVSDRLTNDGGSPSLDPDARVSFSREALAQRRTQTVESAASSWERQIEHTLIDSQRPSEGLIGGSATLSPGLASPATVPYLETQC